MRKLFVPLIVVPLLQACPVLHDTNTAATAEMNKLEISLRRLGTAVQGLLWSGVSPDADLPAMVCQNDPSLCGAFGGNKLYTKVVDGNAVLLLCTQDRKRALVEDIACTPTPDFKAWADGDAPCEFTLSEQTIREACR